MQPICKFHLRGRCRYGERCRNPHVGQREEVRVPTEAECRREHRSHMWNLTREIYKKHHPMRDYRIRVHSNTTESHWNGYYRTPEYTTIQGYEEKTYRVPPAIYSVEDFLEKVDMFRPHSDRIEYSNVRIELIHILASIGSSAEDSD